MNIDLASKKFIVKDTTRRVFVPENPVAQLMYYLHCVSGVIDTNKLNGYTNYLQYNFFPDFKIPELIALTKLFNPEVMIKLRLFSIVDYLDLENRFLEITNETIGVHANQEVIIGGVIVRIRKIMICIKEWLLRYYYMAQRKAQNYFNRQMFSPVPIRRRNDRDYSDEEICCCNIF